MSPITDRFYLHPTDTAEDALERAALEIDHLQGMVTKLRTTWAPPDDDYEPGAGASPRKDEGDRAQPASSLNTRPALIAEAREAANRFAHGYQDVQAQMREAIHRLCDALEAKDE